MSSLLPVNCWDGILPAYRTTPVAGLLAYHNLGTPHRRHDRAEFLIGMCMDNRVVLRIPDNFAYPRVMVAPLFYHVGEGFLHQITEGEGC